MKRNPIHPARDSFIEPLESRIAPAAIIVQLSGLTGANGFAIPGLDGGDGAGYSVSGAGDVNGDGFDDIIVGAPIADGGVPSSGAAYVLFGTNLGFAASIDLSTLDGTNGFRINGAEQSDLAGGSVSGAGDVNADGFDDIIVGAANATGIGPDSGAAYVIFGAAVFGASIDLAALDGANGFKISGAAAGDESGASVSGAGDVNGDGFADVIVGAPGANNDAGAAYVLLGKGAAFAPEIALGTLNRTDGFRIDGQAEGDGLGAAVSRAGDVNGDGFDDVIVGAPSAYAPKDSSGASYVILGTRGPGNASLNVALLNGSNGFKISGVGEYDYSGSAVGGAGDINGDGFDDIIIGASQASPNGDDSGAAYVVFGKNRFRANIDLSDLNGSNGFKLSGGANDDYAGFSVSGAGDVNGDGIADIIVGASGASGDEGVSYVVYGKKGSFPQNLQLSTLSANKGFRIHGAQPDSSSGSSVRAAGDVNGDGIDDLIIGAYAADGIGTGAGAAYVLFGKPDPGNPLPGTFVVDEDGRTAIYTDLDGDRVRITLGGGLLSSDMIHLTPDGHIELIDLTGLAAAAAKAGKNKNKALKLSIAVTHNGAGGDGLVDIGKIDATGVAMSSLKVEGDLSALSIGSEQLAGQSQKSAVKEIRVQSMGMSAGLFPNVSPTAHVPGGVKNLNVAGNISKIQAALGGPGKTGVGRMSVGGSMLGTSFDAPGGINSVKVTGNVEDATFNVAKRWNNFVVLGEISDSSVFVDGTLKVLVVTGDVTDSTITAPGVSGAANQKASTVFTRVDVGDFVRSQLLVGYDADGQPVNGNASIGKVNIRGVFTASSIVAGADAGPDGFFGTGDDFLIGGADGIIARIASVTIKGQVSGSADAAGDRFGIVAEEIGKITIGRSKISLTDGARNDLGPLPLGGALDVVAMEAGA